MVGVTEEQPKPKRQVPTIVKVKAFLAIAMPALFLGLIALGFVPMFEGGETLWDRVGQKFFGAEGPSPHRTERPRPDPRHTDPAKYEEALRSDNRGELMSAGMDIEETLRELGDGDPELKKRLEGILAEIQKKLAASAPPKSDVIIPSGKTK